MPKQNSYDLVLLSTLVTAVLVGCTTATPLATSTASLIESKTNTPTTTTIAPAPTSSLEVPFENTPDQINQVPEELIHTDWGISDIAWSPNRVYLAVAAENTFPHNDYQTTLSVWDIATTEQIHILEASEPNCTIRLVDWEKNEVYETGLIVGAGSCSSNAPYEETVIVWDASTKEELYKFIIKETVFGLDLSPDVTRLAIASVSPNKMGIVVWDLEKDEQIIFANSEELTDISLEWIQDVAWSPDSKYLAFSAGQGAIILWTPQEPSQVQILHETDRITDERLDWGSNGLLAASTGNLLRIWNVKTNTLQSSQRFPTPIIQIEFSSDGSLLAIGLDHAPATDENPSLVVMEVDTGKSIYSIDEYDLIVTNDVAWDPLSNFLALASWHNSYGRIALLNLNK